MKNILEKGVTSSATRTLQITTSSVFAFASCGTYSTVMPCVAVHAVLSLWVLFLGVHYSCTARPRELLSKWGKMGRDENPESVEQWDIGFKSCMAISKDFYSWCRTHYIWAVSSTENNSKSRLVCVGWGGAGGGWWQKSHSISFCLGRRKIVKALMSVVCSPCLLILISRGDEESTKNET